ncbi:MAG: hypothetical protein M1837_007311 [Sclerophora amabilis]|nr:MAG: hypothetical protein M1837_007311 [Sclerophora amabilis]
MLMLNNLSNPLATPDQLSTSGSQLDGIPAELESSIRYAAIRLTQAAGILLRLPQDIIGQAIVVFTRFWVGPEGGSLRQHGAMVCPDHISMLRLKFDILAFQEISAASLYMMAKLSALPQTPRNLLNVYAYLISTDSPLSLAGEEHQHPNPETYYLSEGTYYAQRNNLMKSEALILRTLGFQTHVALPYTLAINYLQALDIFGRASSAELSRRTFSHLSAALMSPQLLYLTHQPSALATAAIYLAARELGVKLPSEEWWEVFDVDREELGFLVVGMGSMEGFAAAEKEKWADRNLPLTVSDVEIEMHNWWSAKNGE